MAGMLVLIVGATWLSLRWVSSEADALATREYQVQQTLLAAQAAERLDEFLLGVGRRIDMLRPPADPRTAPADWLVLAATGPRVALFVHDEDGRVVATSPDLPAAERAWLNGQRDEPIDAEPDCEVCVSQGSFLTVTRSLAGHEGLHVSAAIDERRLHERLFGSLSRAHDAYVWVMDPYRSIVSAPSREAVGTRPFDSMPESVVETLGPILDDMVRGRSGTGEYTWVEDGTTQRRLVAYTPTRAHAGLFVAHSADRSAVLAMTQELHAREEIVITIGVVLLVLALLLAGGWVVRGLRQELEAARRLGQYDLHEKLGEGGMGVVYRASHAMLRRPAAIKLLRQEVIDAAAAERFEREARLTASLTHPNTVTVYDFGVTPDGTFYFAMELLDGITLEELVWDYGPQDPSRVLHMLRQIAAGLSEAHEIGLIHRDVKPANIMLVQPPGRYDVIKIVDFGIVREMSAIDPREAERFAGTPQFASPEAIESPGAIDGRSDLYSLGAVAYYLLTGTDVFDGTAIEVLKHHLHTEVVPPSQRLERPLPPDLERIVLDCLAKDPGDRPSSAKELCERLDSCDVEPWTSADAEVWWRSHRGSAPSPPPPDRANAATVAAFSANLGTQQG